MVRNTEDETGVCTKTTEEELEQESSTVLWMFSVNSLLDNIHIKKENFLISGAFLQKRSHPKIIIIIIIGPPFCHECSVVFKGLCVCNSILSICRTKTFCLSKAVDVLPTHSVFVMVVVILGEGTWCCPTGD